MTKQEIIEKLKDLQGTGDTEVSHARADDLLCEWLEHLGYGDIVEEWNKVDKWYA